MNAFIKFNRGMLRMPMHLRLWVLLLVSANVVSPLFFRHHPEAFVVLGTTLLSMMLMTFLTARFGFTRIVGLGHILWVPMIAFLVTRLGGIPADDFFGVWIRTLLVLNSISLVFDATDVIRYLAGERIETVTGL